MEPCSLPGLSVAALGPSDIPGAMRLVEEARWNQVPADWALFVAHGAAFKACAPDGTIVATAAVLPYPPQCGWISMVLVAGTHRRRGIATALLQSCIAQLREAGLVPVLDATPAGREVYRPLGFRDGWPITRWRRPADATAGVLPQPTRSVRAFRDDDWTQVARLDAVAFGADRLDLLRSLRERSRGFACVVEEAGRIQGCLLGRDGRAATQLGPLVAEDDDVAHALLAHALPRVQGTVLLDVLDRHAAFAGRLAQAGFAVERPYTRMALEFGGEFGDAARMVAIAGPELG